MKKLSELNLSELTSKRNTLKSTLISFIILGVLIAVVMFYLRAKLVLFIPVMVLPITWLPIFISIKSIDEEIKSRQV